MKKTPLQAAMLLMTVTLAACGKSEPPPAVESAAPTTEPAREEHHAGAIRLTAEQVNAARIGLAQAGPASLRETLPLYGVIAPNAERVREVAARFPGVIRSVGKKVGDPVGQGESMAIIESNESLQSYAVTAPLAGVVTMRNANPGEQSGDKALFTVADLSTVWVELALFPRDVAKIQLGQSVRVRSADAGLSADGQLVYVAPFGSSSNQTLTARVLLDNARRRWAPGLYVSADVTLAVSSVPLAIRAEAVQTVDEASVVFVRDDEGFKPRTVRLGRNDGEQIEVLEGLSAGETYATANSFVLKAEIGKGEAGHED